MAWNLLVANGGSLLVREYAKSLSDFGHLLGDSVGPKGIAITAVKLKGFFDGPWYFNTKFVGPLKKVSGAFSCRCNNSVTFPQHMRYPPVKGWFAVNAHGHGIFCGLKWMGFL